LSLLYEGEACRLVPPMLPCRPKLRISDRRRSVYLTARAASERQRTPELTSRPGLHCAQQTRPSGLRHRQPHARQQEGFPTRFPATSGKAAGQRHSFLPAVGGAQVALTQLTVRNGAARPSQGGGCEGDGDRDSDDEPRTPPVRPRTHLPAAYPAPLPLATPGQRCPVSRIQVNHQSGLWV
jgi:hypothetical protein